MDSGAELFDDGMRHYGATRLQAAAVCFRAALDQLDSADEQQGLMRFIAYEHLGWIDSFHGRPRQAISWFIRCLESAESAGLQPAETVAVLLDLAKAEHDLGLQQGPAVLTDEYVNEPTMALLRQAEYHLDAARGLLGEVAPDAMPTYVTSLVLSAAVAREMEDLPTAVEICRHALEVIDSRPMPVQVGWAVLREYALAGVRIGEPAQVVDLVASILAQTDELVPSPEVADCLAAAVQAAVLAEEHDLHGDFAGQLLAIDWEKLGHHLSGRSARQARHVFNAFRRRAEIVLGAYLVDAAYDDARTTWEIPPSLYEISLNRKGILAEREGRAWLAAHAAGPADEVTEILRVRRRLAALDLGDSQETTIKGTRLRYDEVASELDEIEGGWLEATETGDLAYLRTEDVLDRLAEGQMLLDLVVTRTPDGRSRYGVMQLRPGHPVRFRDLGAVDVIDGTIADAVRAVARPPQQGEDQLQLVVDLLSGLRLLGPDDDPPYHLLFSPAGSWANLPPYLLPDAAGLPLIDGHLVTLLPSARWLVNRADRSEPHSSARPLVIGDPDFDLDLDEHKEFFLRLRPPRLKHSRAEAEAVAGILGVAPVLDAAACRDTLLTVSGPRILHLATHGLFIDKIASIAEISEPRETRMRGVLGIAVSEELEPTWAQQDPVGIGFPAQEALHLNRARWLREIGPTDQASRSLLLLAGFNAWLGGVRTPDEIGVGAISASELTLLDLVGTELVVLSACSTGVGAVDYADAGHIGLRTAAGNAGARSVISTLWEVLDSSAVVTMAKYYEQIVAHGLGRGEALRDVLLELRADHPAPYFWAGWVLEGDIDPLPDAAT